MARVRNHFVFKFLVAFVVRSRITLLGIDISMKSTIAFVLLALLKLVAS